MVKHAIRCGELLLEVKEEVGHGGWLNWLAEHFDGSEDIAQLYMRLARHKAELIEPNTERVRYFSLREALAAIAPPREPDVAPPDEDNEDGEGAPESAGEETSRKSDRTEPAARSGTASPGAEPAFYRGADLPVAADALAEVLGDGRPVVLTCDVPVASTAGKKVLREAKVFVEAAARAAAEARRDAHLLVLCSPDPEIREAAERALALAPPSSEPDDPFAEDYGVNDEISPEDRKRERHEKRVLREEEKANLSLYQAIIAEGGIRTRDDLREEYRGIPNCYKRRDGLRGDEMADHLAAHRPEFGIRTERDLIDALTRRKRAA